MSLPRRAMEQMGFSLCCLNCDAPDIPGSDRCKACIQSHTKARDRLMSGKSRTKAQRLAREMVTMLADPFSHIDDDDHGKWMEMYAELIRQHQFDPVSDDKDQRTVHRLRLSRKKSLIRDVANQNKWSDRPPDELEINEMRELLRDGESKPPMTWDDLISEIEGMLEE